MRGEWPSIFAFWAITIVAGAFETRSLVFYVPFEEGRGEAVADMSDSKMKGKITGTVKWVSPGAS